MKRIINKIRNEGLKKTTLDSFSRIYDHYYDHVNGIDTCSWVSNEELVKENPIGKDASSYQGTKVLPLRRLLKQIDLSNNDVLVDIGSGKGRVLLVASEFGLSTLRGIEFSKSLCDIANENIKIYNKKRKTTASFEIYNIDASIYDFKDDETIFFLYNPFNNNILSKVLQNISNSIRSNPRPIQIINAYPIDRKYIEPFFDIKSIKDYIIWNGRFTVYQI